MASLGGALTRSQILTNVEPYRQLKNRWMKVVRYDRDLRMFAGERRPQPFVGHASSPVDMIDASSVDGAWLLREIRANHFATTTVAATEHTYVSREKPR